MELRQLEHLVAVVEEGSFTSGAARVHMVQSSLSASLRSLERELGAELVIRGPHGIQVTDAGRAFLAPARQALAEVQRARDAVAEVHGVVRGTVCIAYTVVHPRGFAGIMAGFRRSYPGVQVRAVAVGVRKAEELLVDGQVDFALMARPARAGPALRFESLGTVPLVLICPMGHRLAGAREVPIADVLPEPIIDVPRGWAARRLFDQMIAAHGFARPVTLEVQDWLNVLSLVQHGAGIAYGAESCIDEDLFTQIAIASLAGAPTWDIGIAFRDRALRGAPGRAFLAAYLEYLRATSARCG